MQECVIIGFLSWIKVQNIQSNQDRNCSLDDNLHLSEINATEIIWVKPNTKVDPGCSGVIVQRGIIKVNLLYVLCTHLYQSVIVERLYVCPCHFS